MKWPWGYGSGMKLRRPSPSWILALLAAGFVALLALRTHDTITRLQDAQTERAWMLAHTLAATVQGVARHGPDAQERVQAVFEEVAHSPTVAAVGLLDASGSPLLLEGVEAGTWLPWAAGSDAEYSVRSHEVAVIMPFDLTLGHKMGRGSHMQREGRTLKAGGYRLLLVLDTSTASGVRAHILGSDLALLLVGLILSLMGLLLLRSQARNHQLRERVALQEQRRKGLENLRLLAAGLAHETRNPLGAIRGYTQLLHEESQDDDVRARTALILEQIDLTTERLDEFLAFARPRVPRRESVDLRELARGVVELLSPDAQAAGVQLSVQADEGVVVQGDRRQLQEALFNLVLNAIQVCASGDQVRVRARVGGGAMVLEVEDDGPGIPAEDLPRLTEPYFTRRGGGSGLGLAIVQRVAEAHHTTLAIHSVQGEGSRFTLPLLRELPPDD